MNWVECQRCRLMREAVSECLQHKRRPFHAIFPALVAWKRLFIPLQGVAEIYQEGRRGQYCFTGSHCCISWTTWLLLILYLCCPLNVSDTYCSSRVFKVGLIGHYPRFSIKSHSPGRHEDTGRYRRREQSTVLPPLPPYSRTSKEVFPSCSKSRYFL